MATSIENFDFSLFEEVKRKADILNRNADFLHIYLGRSSSRSPITGWIPENILQKYLRRYNETAGNEMPFYEIHIVGIMDFHYAIDENRLSGCIFTYDKFIYLTSSLGSIISMDLKKFSYIFKFGDLIRLVFEDEVIDLHFPSNTIDHDEVIKFISDMIFMISGKRSLLNSHFNADSVIKEIKDKYAIYKDAYDVLEFLKTDYSNHDDYTNYDNKEIIDRILNVALNPLPPLQSLSQWEYLTKNNPELSSNPNSTNMKPFFEKVFSDCIEFIGRVIPFGKEYADIYYIGSLCLMDRIYALLYPVINHLKKEMGIPVTDINFYDRYITWTKN